MENDMLLFSAGSLGRLVRRTLDRNVRNLGLSTAQIRVLIYLSGNSGAVQHDIEESLSLARATVSQTVDSLEAMGLINREKVAADGRLRRLVLTDEGRRKLESSKRYADDVERSMLDAISSEERDAFIDICRRLRNVLEESQC